MPYMEPHAIHLKKGDEITLQYLGAALVGAVKTSSPPRAAVTGGQYDEG